MTGLHELLAAATPRPWEADGKYIRIWFGPRDRLTTMVHSEENAALIVGLVNAADELLARLEKLEAVAEAARPIPASDPFAYHDLRAALAALAAVDAKTGAA